MSIDLESLLWNLQMLQLELSSDAALHSHKFFLGQFQPRDDGLLSQQLVFSGISRDDMIMNMEHHLQIDQCLTHNSKIINDFYKYEPPLPPPPSSLTWPARLPLFCMIL